MEEQTKNAGSGKVEAKKPSVNVKTVGKYLLGAILLIAGALLLWKFWPKFVILVKGCVGPFLILAGLITIAIAKE